MKILRNKISSFSKARSDGPLLGLLSSSAQGKLLLSLKSLFTSPSDLSEASIPLIELPGNLDGSSVGNSAILPPLDWQRFGLKRSFEILVNLNVWINESKSLARFSQIPFGNLPVKGEEGGLYSFIADVFFGRELRQRGYLLPHQLDKDLSASLIESDESVDLEVERSGISENVVVEVEMIGFALNCLLQYQSILGPEGAESVCNDTAGLYPSVDSKTCNGNSYGFDRFFNWETSNFAYKLKISFCYANSAVNRKCNGLFRIFSISNYKSR